MNLLDRNIDKIKNICDKHKVSRLYVFGSILTNKFTKTSDIDFVVDFKNVSIYNYADNYFNLKA
ncbi:MAG: nucleotidyltransferase, partial [Candidatus Schekmanbacteria bacterium]